MEIARMFGSLPSELLAIPTSEYRRLQHYYFAVKEKESKAQEPDEPDESDLE